MLSYFPLSLSTSLFSWSHSFFAVRKLSNWLLIVSIAKLTTIPSRSAWMRQNSCARNKGTFFHSSLKSLSKAAGSCSLLQVNIIDVQSKPFCTSMQTIPFSFKHFLTATMCPPQTVAQSIAPWTPGCSSRLFFARPFSTILRVSSFI